MLDIQQIESFYPEYLKPFKRNLLREYLQFKILDRCQNVEFKKLAQDVEPFLYDPQSADKILHFPEFIKTVKI